MPGMEICFTRRQLLQGTLLLVDKEHPLPDDFPLPNLRTLRAMVGKYLPVWEDTALLPEAVYALCEMKLDYSLDSGITFTRGALSGAQLDEWQRQAFQDYAKVYPLEEAMQMALSLVPGARESEHRLGYALDLELHPPLSLGKADPLMQNEVGCWMKEHLAEYGWIYRFGPDDPAKGECRGIHIRYVGKVHALAMDLMDAGLEAYWEILKKEKGLTLYRRDQPIARIYCAPVQQELSVLIPDGYEYSASLDYQDWAVWAIWEAEAF